MRKKIANGLLGAVGHYAGILAIPIDYKEETGNASFQRLVLRVIDVREIALKLSIASRAQPKQPTAQRQVGGSGILGANVIVNVVEESAFEQDLV